MNKLEKIKKKYSNFQKIVITYSDVKREYFPTESQYVTEKDALPYAQIIARTVEKLGFEVHLYPGNADLPQRLRRHKPDLVINLVDSVKGVEFLSTTIPATLDLLEIPYTGADMLGMALNYNKFLTKKLLQQNGVPVPHYQLFNSYTDPLDPTIRFPLISKLNEIHGSVEITKDAISENEKHLRERLKFLIKTYDQPVLVEEYIVGREVACFLFEGLNKKVYMGERIFHKPNEKYLFTTFEDQWLDLNNNLSHYQKYQDALLKEYIRKAFYITRLADYGKFDVRIDSSGRYFFIDVNSNPAFGPKETDADMSYVLDLYGVPFMEILDRLLLNTIRDAQLTKLTPYTNGNHKK